MRRYAGYITERNKVGRMVQVDHAVNTKTFFFIFWVYLFVFQSPLEEVCIVFKLVDEVYALLFVPLLLFTFIEGKDCYFKKDTAVCVFSLFVFLAAGIAGNILYQYQIWSLVFQDIFTNVKYFMTIGTSALYFSTQKGKLQERKILFHLKVITLILFTFFLLDRIFNFWPAEVRYGIKSAKLFYQHSTYLAAAVCFVSLCFVVFYRKENDLFIFLNLIMVFFTLRSKAIVSAAVFALLFLWVVKWKKKIKIWQICAGALLVLWLGWSQISFYYIQLGGASARSVMTSTSFQIMRDYFPIGTGFGTYASHAAAVDYSPVYVMYGFLSHIELGTGAFLDDTFWPIIIGQTGFIGILFYILAHAVIVRRVFALRRENCFVYMAGMFILAYMLISSTSESAFNNPIAISFAMLMGCFIAEPHELKSRSYRDRITLNSQNS